MAPLRLSICIPVYNFGAFLGPTLESILPQAGEGVEVVVFDGGSTDETPALMARLQAAWPRLRYCRRSARGGIDRDMALAVAEARGEYCWVFSGDDLMRPDAVARVLAELDGGCDAYLLESMLCDFEMRPMSLHRMARIPAPRTFQLRDPLQRAEYFTLAENTAAFFSFCSAVVVRKARWDEAGEDERYYGTCWAHAARLLGLIPAGLELRYLPGPFLDKRGDNDSFNTRGLTPRYAIAVDGFHRIADELFGAGSREAFHLRRAVRGDLPWQSWLVAKAEIAARGLHDQRPLFRRLLRKAYADPSLANWLTWAACRAVPGFLLPPLKRAFDAARGLPSRRRAGTV